jgi:hypothetical protein
MFFETIGTEDMFLLDGTSSKGVQNEIIPELPMPDLNPNIIERAGQIEDLIIACATDHDDREEPGS